MNKHNLPLMTTHLVSRSLVLRSGGEAERLVQEVTRLYRERYRLARMHRKAEFRVLASLRRRRQVRLREREEEEVIRMSKLPTKDRILRKRWGLRKSENS